MKGVRWSLWVLVAFAALVGLFALQLSRPKNDTVQSTMIGKPMPQFALPPAIEQRPGLSSADLADGTPHLLNVFASWCVPCAAEAPRSSNVTATRSAASAPTRCARYSC